MPTLSYPSIISLPIEVTILPKAFSVLIMGAAADILSSLNDITLP
jgi:hypothetical protein